MSVSFEGVGQVCATFLGGKLAEGQVVKLTGNGTVGACGDGDHLFCGPWFLYLFCYFAENEKISSIICSVCYNKR